MLRLLGFALAILLGVTLPQAQVEAAPAKVFVGYTWYDKEGDKQERDVVEVFLEYYLRHAFGNRANLTLPKFLTDWTADSAVDTVKPPFDHYIIAWMEKVPQGGCDGVFQTDVTFEVGRITSLGDKQVLNYATYLEDDTNTLVIFHPNCSGLATLKSKVLEIQDPDQIARNAAATLAQFVPQYLPELQKYDPTHPFIFNVSCVRKTKKWMISDILSSKDSPEDMSEQFLFAFLKDLIDPEAFLKPWGYTKPDIIINDWKVIKGICSHGNSDSESRRVELRAMFSDSDSPPRHIILEIHVFDALLKDSLAEVNTPPKVSNEKPFEDMKNNALQASEGLLIRHCEPGLWRFYSDNPTIAQLASTVRNYVDGYNYHPNNLECNE